MRKALCVLLAAVAVLVSLVGTATAEPAGGKVTITAPRSSGVSAQALSCAAGDLCAWPVSDGSRNRCSWTNADANWQAAPVTCSWSGSNAVQAVYNNGRSTSYVGVCLYPATNYGGNTAYFVYQGDQAPGFPGVVIRSHRWDADGWCF